MKDANVANAYFYMTPYPTESTIDVSALKPTPAGTLINNKYYNGAILLLNEFEHLSEIDKQVKIISFVKSVSNRYLNF